MRQERNKAGCDNLTRRTLLTLMACIACLSTGDPTWGRELGTIETTLVDTEADFYGTFQSHNQKVVVTPDGIFLTYSRNRVLVPGKPETEAARWRLVLSTDGGKTFRTVFCIMP